MERFGTGWGGPRGVEGPSGKFGTAWETLREVRDRLGMSGTGRGTLWRGLGRVN